MTVTKRTRYEVLRRDEHTCRYCHATDQPLTVDHVVPVALGGTDDPSNLVAACKDCNAGKSSSSPDQSTVAQVADDAMRWRLAMEQASAWAAAELAAGGQYEHAFLGEWNRYLPSGYEASLAAMRKAGLPLADLLYAARVAQEARGVDDRWRYFCGVAWKRLQLIQEKALEILGVDQDDADETGPEWHKCRFCDRKVDIHPEDYEEDQDLYAAVVADARCSECDEAFWAGSQYGFDAGLSSHLRVTT